MAGSRLGKMQSRVANSGHGLFTYGRIREGRTVGEYFGTIVIKDYDHGAVNDLIASYSMGNHDSSIINCVFSIRNLMIALKTIPKRRRQMEERLCSAMNQFNGF